MNATFVCLFVFQLGEAVGTVFKRDRARKIDRQVEKEREIGSFSSPRSIRDSLYRLWFMLWRCGVNRVKGGSDCPVLELKL